MRRFGLSAWVFLLAFAGGVPCADSISITKEIPAPTGPWMVTPSVNYDYPYGGSSASPPVLFSAADGFGFLAGDVLTIRWASGMWCGGTYVSVGTCVDANGYRIYGPADDHPLGMSTLYAPSKYMDPATYPIYLMQLVGTFADARGQIVGAPFKVGNGPVSVTVPSGAAQIQLGANMYSYVDARNYYDILKATVSGPPAPVMKEVGSMAHLAVGGLWKTTIVLVNSDTRAVQARLNLFDDAGMALPLALTFPQSPPASPLVVSTLDRMVAAGASLAIEGAGQSSQSTQVGWAQLLADGSLSGFAIFGLTAHEFDQEAVVPLENRGAGSYVLWFDNTGNLVVGLALANISPQPVAVGVTIRSESGVVLGAETITVPAHGHTSFELPVRLPQTAKLRGTVEFHTAASGQISVLGLRFNPAAFTTIPVIAK